jgi:hypothetical protein
MGLAEEKALAIFASRADERGFVSGLFTSRYNVSAKIVSRSITDLHSGALTLSVPQSATNEQSSLSAGGGGSRPLALYGNSTVSTPEPCSGKYLIVGVSSTS